MDVETAARAYLAKWARAGGAIRNPPSEGELERVEERLGIPLPLPLRQLYQVADGTRDRDNLDLLDAEFIRLWPVAELELSSEVPGAVEFADYMLNSSVYRFVPTTGAIVSCLTGTPETVAPSLETFLIDCLNQEVRDVWVV